MYQSSMQLSVSREYLPGACRVRNSIVYLDRSERDGDRSRLVVFWR
jgi:hypothetical protein